MVHFWTMTLEDLASHSGQSVAIIGGTFDPVHHGHLVLAECAREHYELDLVLIMPNRLSPLKEQDEVTTGEDRYIMVELAVADNPHFVVCRHELEQPGPSYSIDTIRAVRKALPGDTQLIFVTGADAILEFLDWREPEAILDEAQVVTALRPGFDREMIRSALGEERASRIDILDMPAVGICSTDIRRRVSRGQSIRYLTPAAVIGYIYKRGLYGASPPGRPVTQ